MTRRDFVGAVAATSAAAAVSSPASSYAQILGANDRVRFAVIGLHSRAYAHLASLRANAKNAQITWLCDVDSTILAKFLRDTEKQMGYAPPTEKDFRRVLEKKDVDAITIAAPDHWHAPMAIAGLQAGKHVYVEKPCSHNPHEGELLVAAQKKYGKLVQMGSQQRSSLHTIDIVKQIHEGVIGRAYLAHAWYVNDRKSMGTGVVAPVPPTLDWDLWQGPAPRQPYKDNIHPYNWHWLQIYGTGEALNNGTHEVDVARWALDAEMPKSIEATGGRFAFKDDWQFYDTLNASFKYDDKMLTWEGRSCNPMRVYGRERGVLVNGTNGSVIVDRDGYEIYSQTGQKLKEVKANSQQTSSADLTGKDAMTDNHFANFIAGIQHGEALHAPVAVGNVAVTMLQLANIAWRNNRVLNLDASGHVLNDAESAAMTRRTYEKGWEPKI
jgi:predicted dehydrogenase